MGTGLPLTSLLRRLRRNWPDRSLLLASLALLALTRLAILVLPFRRLARRLGPLRTESPAELGSAQEEEARRVGRVVRKVARRTPWTSNCFPQALTALWLLRRRQIPCTLYLGARFGEEEYAEGGPLKGHAWLRAGRIYVTGGDGSRNHGVLARFGGPEGDGKPRAP